MCDPADLKLVEIAISHEFEFLGTIATTSMAWWTSSAAIVMSSIYVLWGVKEDSRRRRAVVFLELFIVEVFAYGVWIICSTLESRDHLAFLFEKCGIVDIPLDDFFNVAVAVGFALPPFFMAAIFLPWSLWSSPIETDQRVLARKTE